ncbi:glycerophosphodiester phosphodiesterase [Planctomicrobium sp. SH664]|uniref:glycerophosphodiester phosphodiesterase n=1 Tax=Planctomicrobium sp. SH664 TaxID=3448125 RepID=UPI003F5AED98
MPIPFVIAHRGASGYLPEHTLEAKALAYAQLADYLEQDLVLTKDNVPVVLHDIHLDTVTDVAQRFPGRQRDDGRYYAIDFTLAEVQSLRVFERFHPKTGKAVFPGRFPTQTGNFRIPTLVEEIQFVQGLNRSTGRTVGIYPELKQPEFHFKEGKDLTAVVLDILTAHGYHEATDPVFLQCFDAKELQRVRHGFHSRLKLIQLLHGDPWNAKATLEAQIQECRKIAGYAHGIGIPLGALFPTKAPEGIEKASRLVSAAHAAGLAVHPWTYRADDLPKSFPTFAELHSASVAAGIDGLFSDFPDQSRTLLREAAESRK